jgi:hypothetical protein
MSKKRVGPITLDGEAADRITVLALKEQRNYLKKELTEWKKNPKTETNPDGYWLHPEDVVRNCRTVKLIDTLLEDFGGELYA